MASRSPELNVPDAGVKQEINQQDIATANNNATTSSSPPATGASGGLSKKELELMFNILARISNYRDKDGHDVSKDFQRMVSKRALPDYFEVIKEPIALSSIRHKINKKQYPSFEQFIRDFFLIPFNAQTYNRRSAPVYSDSLVLADLFRAELKKLVDDGVITAEEAQEPDLGPLPEQEDSPPPGPEDEELEEDDEDEDEDEEEDESDDEPRKRRKKGRRSSVTAKQGNGDGSKEEKNRGRPPKMPTPMEARINNIHRGLRKYKNPGGDLKILPFERLPDKSVMPEYYQEIKNPIAMDLIKRKAKRKKYHSVDQAMQDLELMFENAKSYNLETSLVYKNAVDLQKEARVLAEQEKKKPDTDYVDEHGRLPLPQALHNGEIWKVGDWVLIENMNDISKPIVGQIYRLWQNLKGEKWIVACWYFRPEQTVHRYEKHFFENEVVKTGRYISHPIEAILDRCFVMFVTRYNKGRPRGFPSDKEIFVCEARYNEDKLTLNKIKTWSSCLPDEVREKDYEMDLFDVPRKMRKVPSPIKHYLKEDATENDPLPKPTQGKYPGYPPMVGSVHMRPRQAHESPPPEPTPSPSPAPPEPVRLAMTNEQRRYDSQGDVSMSGTTSHVTPSPSPMASMNALQSVYGQQFVPPRPSQSPAPLTHQNSYGSHGSGSYSITPQTATYQQQGSYNQYGSTSTPVAHHSVAPGNYGHSQYQNPSAPRPVAVSTGSHSGHGNTYYASAKRMDEVYLLPDAGNNAIAKEIRDQFHTDENGRVIFYTAPPLNVNPLPPQTQALGHSLRYLADKARNKEADAKKRKDREAEKEADALEDSKRAKLEVEIQRQSMIEGNLHTIKEWSAHIDAGTDELYKHMHGENWKEARAFDLARLAVKQQEAAVALKKRQDYEKAREAEKEIEITGYKL